MTPLANTLLASKLGFPSPEKLAAYLDFIEPTIAAIESIQDTPQNKWGIWISGGIAAGKTTLATLLSNREVFESARTTTSGLLRLALHGITVALDKYKADLAEGERVQAYHQSWKNRMCRTAEN